MGYKDSHMNGGGQVAVAIGFDSQQGGETSQQATNEGSPPVRQKGRNAVAQKTMVRRLTPTECLRLQGFPDDYFDGFGFSDSVKYRLIGNSVAIPVVQWIARRMANA